MQVIKPFFHRGWKTPTVIWLQPGVAVSNSFKIALKRPMGPAKEDLGNSATDMKQRQQKS